jgi:diguanylate cyclase (GGDEF)-like protein/PAS domain S-box-containing protein
MFTKRLTLQITLVATILLIGLIGIILVISTDITYRELAFKQQEKALGKLLSIKSRDLTNELIQRQKELGFTLQSEETFKSAFNNNDTKKLNYWLDQEFSRYFSTMGLIKLEKLIVYDRNLNIISKSARGLAMGNQSTPPCNSLLQYMGPLSAAERLKPRSELCLYNNKPLLSTIVSIGSLRSKGYIQIVSDPAYMLANIAKELDVELQISTYDQRILHQSSGWPLDSNAYKSFLFGEYTIQTANGSPVMLITGATNISAFYSQLNFTRQQTIVASCLLILVGLVIALSVLHRSLRPLKALNTAANKITKGYFSTIEDRGFPEISTPIRSFNSMIERIQSLVQNLEDEVDSHKDTEEKLRKAMEYTTEQATNAEHQKNFLQMTLESIVDGVITTDTSGHVISMNPVAEQLTGWSCEKAAGRPFSQIMHVLHEHTHKKINTSIEDIENNSVLDEPVSALLVQHGSNVETPVEYVAAPMLDTKDDIAGIVIIIHDESEQRSLNRQLSFQATHDALTGLINRYEFERKLKQVFSESQKSTIQHTLCYLDLDQFKVINDTCGHNAGDELLKQVARLLKGQLREGDVLARLGGDEFGLLLHDCDIKQAEFIAEEILQTVGDYNFFWDEFNFTINASIGITAITNEHESSEELLSNADSACHLAKESGRNRLQVFTWEDDRLLSQQRDMHWVSRINHAMEEGRFKLYFQEIFPLQSDSNKFRRHGEILLRMMDKKGDLISPNMFLPAAERYSIIETIDDWVIEETINWLSRTQNKILTSINISGQSLSKKESVNFIVKKIKDSNINPELLCFEITETAAISHLETAIYFMTVLKKLGCSFALDDFGSGLSSFSYLTSLPVDYLKIDGSFVVDIDKDPMHYAMVKSINEVGHVMGIKTIAEYTASTHIIECLRKIGVDHAQGYAVAKPIPLASFEEDTEKTEPHLFSVQTGKKKPGD